MGVLWVPISGKLRGKMAEKWNVFIYFFTKPLANCRTVSMDIQP